MKAKNDRPVWAFLAGLILAVAVIFCTAWTYTWDTTTPAGSDAPSVIDDRIREVKATVQERLNVDHFMPLTGSQVSDADAGYHRDIHFYSTTAADPVLDFTTVGGVDELRYTDSAGSAIQFTSAGSFNVALLTSKTITTPTLTSPVLNTQVTGTAVLDEDDMASNSATKVATQQSIKAYVDNKVGAGSFSPIAYAGEQSVTFPNGQIFKQGSLSVTANSIGTVTFTDAFPTAVVSGSCSALRQEDLFTYAPHLYVLSASQIRFRNNDNITVTIHWQAWGY